MLRPAVPAPAPSLADRVERADTLYDAYLYRSAVREYVAAREVDPELLDVLFPLAVAQIKIGDHDASYESLAGFLDAGLPVELAATHEHSFVTCQGAFILTREAVSYRSPQEGEPKHWFDVPLKRVVAAEAHVHVLLESRLVIRAPSAKQVCEGKGKSKNWTLFFDLRGEHEEVAKIISLYILCSQGRCPQT